MPPLLIAVMGPTASGKTELAERLAETLGAQLLNADAFQIYRGMDIGTAKPEDKSRYLLLDLKDPDESFGVGEYVEHASQALERLWHEGRSAVVVGGTGLNVRALFEQYAEMVGPPCPELRRQLMERERAEGLPSLVAELARTSPEVVAKLDTRNPARVRRALERALSKPRRLEVRLPPFRKLKLGLVLPPETSHTRIAARTRAMLGAGWLDEVASLAERGYGPNDPGFRAHGYRAMWRHLHGELDLDAALEGTIAEVRRYAKRQRTWLRSEPGLRVLDGEGDALAQALGAIRETGS